MLNIADLYSTCSLYCGLIRTKQRRCIHGPEFKFSLKIIILLMVQKSCDHQLMLVVHPKYLQVFLHPKWCRISESSTVSKVLRKQTHFGTPLHEFLLKSSQKVGLWRSFMNARDRASRLILMGLLRYQTSSRHSLQDHPKACDRFGLLHHQKKFSSLLAVLHKKRLNFPWSFGMKTHLLSYALFCAKQLLLWETLGDVVRQRSNLRAIKDMNVLCVWGTFWLNVILLSTRGIEHFGCASWNLEKWDFSLQNSYV